MSEVLVREATREDVPLILELIRELAEYEKEPEAAVATEEQLLEYGFSPNPVFYTLIGEIDGAGQSFALYFYNFSTWLGKPGIYLEDLFVRPQARGKGLGIALLKELAKIAIEKDCGRMEWSVLDWNMMAREFYHEIGSFHNQAWLPYRMDIDAIQKLASMIK